MTKNERLGDAPIDPEYRASMNVIAKTIDRLFNGEATGADKKTGFVLLIFPFGDQEGRCNYISNANRTDVITMLKAQIKRFEGQPDITGHA